MANTLIGHLEIPVKDLTQTSDFFKKVLGWDFKPFGNGYMLFNNHKGIMVGLRKADNIVSGDNTIFHINVDSIDDVLAKIEDNGGRTVRAKTIIPAMGYYALFNDLNGNIIGLYQANK